MDPEAEALPPRRPGRPSVAEVVEIDRRIREAGLAAFDRLGFAAAQMEGIAAGAGVSKAALYRRYPNKNALLAAIVVAAADDSHAQVQGEMTGADPVTRLKETMRVYRRQRQDERQIELLRLVASSAGHDPAIGGTMDAQRVRYVQPVDDLIGQAMAIGAVRAQSIIALREAMFDLLVNGATSQRLFGMTPDDDDDLFEFRWQLLMDAIGPTDHT